MPQQSSSDPVPSMATAGQLQDVAVVHRGGATGGVFHLAGCNWRPQQHWEYSCRRVPGLAPAPQPTRRSRSGLEVSSPRRDSLMLKFFFVFSMMRKRVYVGRVPTLKDVHPHTKWSLRLRVYQKFHIERIGFRRKRLNLVVLDEEGTKMAATILDEQVDRLEPQITQGMAYYISWMSVVPITGWQQIMFAGNRHPECRFTYVTTVFMLRDVDEQSLPFFPRFLPCKQIFPFTLVNDIYVDAIGMVMRVSSVAFKDDYYHRRIPFMNVQLMDANFDSVKVLVRDKLVCDNFASWVRSNRERQIVIVTMLRARHGIDHILHTTVFSRVHFTPNVIAARQMKQKINNEMI